MEKLKPLGIVALLIDVPEVGLRRGDVGTVVEVFESTDHHPEGYLVEFVNKKGETQVELSVTDPEQIMQLNFKLYAA
jgi:Domain of unknown function (DUF4926)